MHTLVAPPSPLHPFLLDPTSAVTVLQPGELRHKGQVGSRRGVGGAAPGPLLHSFLYPASRCQPRPVGSGRAWVSTSRVAEGTQGDRQRHKEQAGQEGQGGQCDEEVKSQDLHGTQGLRPHTTSHAGRVLRPSELPSKELGFIAALQSPRGLHIGTCRKHSNICRGSLLPRPRVGGSEFGWRETSSFPHLPNAPTPPGAQSLKGSIWLIQGFLSLLKGV